jgi:GET complex subunit GET2
MGGAGAGQPSLHVPPSKGAGPNADASSPPVGDPISALFASLGGEAGGSTPDVVPPRPRTLTQKLIPVLHVLSMIAILVWFVVWKEPETFAASWLSSATKVEGSEQEAFVGHNLNEFGWRRWARLAKGPPVTGLAVPPLVRRISV